MCYITFLLATRRLGLMVTKDEYTDTLRAYQERKNEIKSDMRAKAVASGLFENIYEG